SASNGSPCRGPCGRGLRCTPPCTRYSGQDSAPATLAHVRLRVSVLRVSNLAASSETRLAFVAVAVSGALRFIVIFEGPAADPTFTAKSSRSLAAFLDI